MTEATTTLTRAAGQAGTLRATVVYQARGPKQQRVPLFRASFTADDLYQEWDEEDQVFFRSSVLGEFMTQADLDAYVARTYKTA